MACPLKRRRPPVGNGWLAWGILAGALGLFAWIGILFAERELHVTSANGSREALPLMHNAPFLSDRTGPGGATALHFASTCGSLRRSDLAGELSSRFTRRLDDQPLKDHPLIVSELILLGADPHARTHSGSTALHYAAVHCGLEVVGTLLDAGADPEARDGSGRSTEDLAREAGRTDVLALLSDEPDPSSHPCRLAELLTEMEGDNHDLAELLLPLCPQFDPRDVRHLLSHPYWLNRKAALVVLARVSDLPDSIAATVEDLARSDEDSSVRAAAWAVLGAHGRVDDDGIRKLEDSLRGPSIQGRADAYEALRAVRPEQPGCSWIQLMLEPLANGSWDEKSQALAEEARSMAQAGTPWDMTPVGILQSYALSAGNAVAFEEDCPAIASIARRAAGSTIDDWRRLGLLVLGRQLAYRPESERAWELFHPLLQDPDSGTRRQAAGSIRRLGHVSPDIVGDLTRLLDDPDVRYTAAWALATSPHRTRAVVEMLAKAVHDEEQAWFGHATILWQLGADGEAASPILEQWVGRRRLEGYARAILMRTDPARAKEHREAFLAILRDPANKYRGEFISFAVRAGERDDEMMRLGLEMMTADREEVREGGIRVLQVIDDETCNLPIGQLEDWMWTAPDRRVRLGAARAMRSFSDRGCQR